MKADKVVELKGYESGSMGGFVKLYAHGKIGLLFEGPEEYRIFAEECFKRALDVQVTIDHIRFVDSMRDRGVTEAAIFEFLKTCTVIDEVHLGGLSLQ